MPVIGGDGLYGSTLREVAGLPQRALTRHSLRQQQKQRLERNFVKNYTAKYGEIETYAPYAYDAANILLKCHCRIKDNRRKEAD